MVREFFFFFFHFFSWLFIQEVFACGTAQQESYELKVAVFRACARTPFSDLLAKLDMRKWFESDHAGLLKRDVIFDMRESLISLLYRALSHREKNQKPRLLQTLRSCVAKDKTPKRGKTKPPTRTYKHDKRRNTLQIGEKRIWKKG